MARVIRLAPPARRVSLRLRVFAAIALAGLAPLLLVFAWSLVDRNVPGRMWHTTLLAANETAAALVAAHGDVEEARPALERVAASSHLRVRVLDPSFAVRLDVSADDPTDAFYPLEALLLGEHDEPSLDDLDRAMVPLSVRPEVLAAPKSGLYINCASEGLFLCQATRAADVPGGKDIVYVQKSTARAITEVYTLRAQLLRLAVLIVPLVLLLAYTTGSRITRPLEMLRAQALLKASEASAEGDLTVHRDEVGDLASSLNALLAALATRSETYATFVADLVHQMKSPVAAVRATSDALQTGSPDDRTRRLARVLDASAEQLDHLVTHFLELARVQAGMPDEAREPVDVGALLRATVARMAEDARFARVRFTAAAEEPTIVAGVEHRLSSLVRELLENAASFAQEGEHEGRVDARVTATTTEVLLAIEDSGPGIPPEDRARVFDRFFTTRGRRRGTGLGLALVRAVAEAHGGSAQAGSSESSGARLEVRFPRAVL
jgi:signal transduction histidine kinase